MSAAEIHTAAYRAAVIGLTLILVVLLTMLATGGSYQRRGVIEVDYGTPTPPAGTIPRSVP